MRVRDEGLSGQEVTLGDSMQEVRKAHIVRHLVGAAKLSRVPCRYNQNSMRPVNQSAYTSCRWMGRRVKDVDIDTRADRSDGWMDPAWSIFLA